MNFQRTEIDACHERIALLQMLIKEKRKNLEAGKVLIKILQFLKLPYSLDIVML